jgi:hypothetical protein
MPIENVNPETTNTAPATHEAPAAPPQVHPASPEIRRRREPRVNRVRWTAHPKTFFLWPIVAAGYVFTALDKWGWVSPGTLGWLYVLLMTMVILTVTVDLGLFWAAFSVLVVLVIYFLGRWLQDAKSITIIGDIYRAFAHLQVQYDRATGTGLSILLSFPFAIGLLWAWFNNRYTMTHNEIVHHQTGRGDVSVGRGARVIRVMYPDAFEYVLGFAGTISIYDNTGRNLILKTEQVPLLPLKKRKIEKILESLEVTTDDGSSDTADVGDHAGADDMH